MQTPDGLGLGRLYAEDPRDEDYPLRLLMSAPPVSRAPLKIWRVKWLLDQGANGTCVGHGSETWMLSSPIMKRMPTTSPTAIDIYLGATQLDEFPDNDNGDLTYGTTVRAAFKWLQQAGHVKGSYNNTQDVNTVADFLAGRDANRRFVGGPVVIGVNWYSSMRDVDANGYLTVQPNASILGGHCVALIGWDQARGSVLGINSWGTKFGIVDPDTNQKTGRFWMTGETLDRLLHEQGECVTASEQKVAKRTSPTATPTQPTQPIPSDQAPPQPAPPSEPTEPTA